MINTTAAPAAAQLTFSASDGTPLTLPLSYAGTTVNGSQLQQTLSPNARLVVNIAGAADSASSDRISPSDQQSRCKRLHSLQLRSFGPRRDRPSGNSPGRSYVFPFDDTGGAATGVAVANSSAVSAIIPLIIYDQSGTQVASSTVTLPAHGQTAFVLSDRIAATVNSKGSARFNTPAGGAISVLGLRFPSSGAFTTIPVITQ